MARKKQPTDTGKAAGKEKAAPPPGFPIVGIGASAGGLEALETLLKAMPTDAGIGYVLVVHLDPTHISILPDLLQKHTRMPVCQAGDGTPVERDHVYVIPPNKDLTILRGTLHLMDLVQPRSGNLRIDGFLRSLAQDQAHTAACIILSGTGSDGTLGVRAIKGEGGLVMVQDEASAKYDGMPRSAIATGLADFVLPPEKMPEQLVSYMTHARHTPAPLLTPAAVPDPQALQRIFAILRSRTGHDFSLYKANTLCRRIERRLSVHQIDGIADYVRFLQESEREAGILFRELLIGVTSFFRDPGAFQALQDSIMAKLPRGGPDGGAIRAWAPGCASGEEAYSVAMMLRECMEQSGHEFPVQIFGTDIDEEAIAVARAGLYPESIVVDVGAERIRRHFTRDDDGHYRVRKQIREMLVFAPQSVIKDPPFTKLDLLCCRNLLIYLGTELQERLLSVFHYSLKPGGILFLGSSETIGQAADLFAEANRKWRLFRRRPSAEAARPTLDFPPRPDPYEARHLEARRGRLEGEELSALQLVETILLQSDTPPCAVIDDAGNAVYIHGRTGRFLEPAEGKASVNIVAMARGGLKAELAAGIQHVAIHKQEIAYRDLEVDWGGTTLRVDLTVRPIAGHAARGLMMVVFEARPSPDGGPKRRTKATVAGSAGRTVEDLGKELEYTRESLQTTIEELETANEELKSTNEELQSTNEELETSKEELQSLNEESATVNAELQARIDELNLTTDDMRNLLDSTSIATVFLDAEAQIRRFTPRATEIIPLTAVDVGRSIQDLATSLKDTDLAAVGRQVLEDLEVRELEVESGDDHWYILRARPYRTVNNVIDGVVMTFDDITAQKRVAQAQGESEERYRTLFELATDPVVLIDVATGMVAEYNQRAHEDLGYTREEFAALTLSQIEVGETDGDVARHMKQIAAQGGDTYATRHRTKSGELRHVQMKARTITVGGRALMVSTWRGTTPAEAGR